MTRLQLESMTFEEQMEWAYENIVDVTHEEILKEFGIKKLQDDCFNWGLHVLSAIYNNDYYTEWYRYDYTMGTLQTPTPITDIDDIEDLIFFEEDEEDE